MEMLVEVSILASHMALPHEGHLLTACHVFSCIKKHHNSHLFFDASYPEIYKSVFMSHDYKEIYGDVHDSRTMLQAVHDAYCNLWTYLHLWRQYVSDPQHAETRINAQEQLHCNLSSCSKVIRGNGWIINQTCQDSRESSGSCNKSAEKAILSE